MKGEGHLLLIKLVFSGFHEREAANEVEFNMQIKSAAMAKFSKNNLFFSFFS
jgi:hypothetical protein